MIYSDIYFLGRKRIDKGIADEYAIYLSLRRQSLHDTGSRYVLKNLEVEDLLSRVTETDSPPKGREECKDQRVGPSKMARTSDREDADKFSKLRQISNRLW